MDILKEQHRSLIAAAAYLFSALALIFLSAGPAAAAVIRVPLDAPTIQQAIDAARKGDTVRVSQGTYFENITLKENVILEGGWNTDFSSRDIAAHETVLDGIEKPGWVVFGADNATLDGFTVTNGTVKKVGDDEVGAGVHCKNTSPIITNNIIKVNAPAGIYCEGGTVRIQNNIISDNAEAGIFLKNKASVTIIGNTIRNNKMAGIGSGKLPASTIDVRNNIIHNNMNAGVDAKSATGKIYNNLIYENDDAGVRIMVAPIEVINNTIVGNGRTGVVSEDFSIKPVIKNNIITHNSESGILSPGHGYSYNLLYGNDIIGECNPKYLWCIRQQYGGYEDEVSYLKKNEMIAEPLFVDAAHHDYHLRPESPAIDAGSPDAVFDDANFPPSMKSDRNDMGAYGGPFTVAETREGNKPPEAHAGPLQREAFKGDMVILDGGGSIDPDGDFISSYHWELIAKPETSKTTLIRPKAVKSGLKIDVAGEYVVRLVVEDRHGKQSQPDTVTIVVPANRPPVASAMDVLPASGSSDPDGDPLTYNWQIIFKPATSRAVLSDPHGADPSFTVDAPGGYEIQLIVNDGKTDSLPATVYINTQDISPGQERHVPADYPTIQSAIDTASPGDNIIVKKGTYKENIVIDKNINLIGIDWPTIDGGGLEGDTNTILIPYLGNKAGRIEGFIIIGGGSGGMGHGINVWDSAVEITNNKIVRNGHNGIGTHGRRELTSATRIHNNFISDNMIGLGNGRNSNAHIYNNHIFNNKVVGVGSRGLASPLIENNYIYGNYNGIGCREVASPHIAGNHIYDNVNGVIISPPGSIKKFAGKDIIIKNNLIFNNHRTGVSITSFNVSTIIVTNNTIDSNNVRYAKTNRGGGLVFGYPAPGNFAAVVENNIITNNKTGGIVNYTGTVRFKEPGVTIEAHNNLVWNNEMDFIDLNPDETNLSEDPLFVSNPSIKNGDYFLSRRAAGQNSDSPGIDTGKGAVAGTGLENGIIGTDMAGDTGVVDLGYHYSRSTAP
jgi:parallel beta-helix repeat protein